jgi:hypothetical protein
MPETGVAHSGENSEPMLPRNGKALSQPHDAWLGLALGAYLLRRRDQARRLDAVLKAKVALEALRYENEAKPTNCGQSAITPILRALHNGESRTSIQGLLWLEDCNGSEAAVVTRSMVRPVCSQLRKSVCVRAVTLAANCGQDQGSANACTPLPLPSIVVPEPM